MLVHNLRHEDNTSAPSSTSSLVAKRIGSTLKTRFEQYIHKKECAKGQADYDVKMTSRSIAAFCVCQLGNVDDEIAGASVCDSSTDGGIDAICINHTEKVVVVVQSKFNQSGSNTWTRNDFLSFKDATDHLLSENLDRFDSLLQQKQKDISIALEDSEYKFKFAMIHTGKKGAASIILEDMQSWQENLNDEALMEENTPEEDWPFQIHLISAEDIQQWLRDGSSQLVDLNGVELIQCGKVGDNQQAIYGTLTGDQIHEWYNQYGTKLFKKNIRNLLGKTDVNDAIKQTAISDPENFWYFNNGITLLVGEISPHKRNLLRNADLKTFDFKNISVINGAQTVSSIGSLPHLSLEHLSKIKVLARFIRLSNPNSDELSNDITKANNHQNRVTGRDFAAQHPEQKRLANEIAIEGYTYTLLRSEANHSVSEKNIDMDDALSALACLTCFPATLATLKSNRGKFFENLSSNLYRSVFNSSISGLMIINAVTLFKCIEHNLNENENKNNNSKKKKNLIIHGTRVLSAMTLFKFHREISKGEKFTISDSDNEEIKSIIERAISLSFDYINENYPSAYLARFFSNREKIEELTTYLKSSLF
ncbi:conserved hypothetical protein [Xenorhabdus bovienii str. puntauvense]|uniref:Abortive phage infection protein C-terminal domain-containing protein n=1 Tax=Xenorhabdus bovienii str. puntauvense TaxID=1398201 RepID=A0A077NKD5_XENBV|nr:AIPR family protein [Xenorhabdus bovienii]CDG99219.1 conserved hypothetical protein [Xenorhabdus bovienii str. puntauvense]